MVYVAEQSWYPTDKNPITADGEYGESWSCFLYDETVLNYSNICPQARLYTLRVSPSTDADHFRLLDFLRYELSYGRNVIFKPNAGQDAQRLLAEFREQIDETPTVGERYMVHSTTLRSWELIQERGALLSPNLLKKNGIQVHEIGLKPMLEPKDYSDYVMLNVLNGCGELVVNSRNRGFVCPDPNAEYAPGVRLYFDVSKIKDAGLVTKDGVHLLKVKDCLPLDGFLVDVISAEMFPSDTVWTPTLFTEKANQLFLSRRKR